MGVDNEPLVLVDFLAVEGVRLTGSDLESSGLGVVTEPLGPGVLAARGERFAGVESGFVVSAGFLTSGVLHATGMDVPSGNTGTELFVWSGTTGGEIFA